MNNDDLTVLRAGAGAFACYEGAPHFFDKAYSSASMRSSDLLHVFFCQRCLRVVEWAEVFHDSAR